MDFHILLFHNILKLHQYYFYNNNELKEDASISYLSNNFSKRSINRKLSSLRGFYRHMKERRVLEENPFDEVQSVKTEKTLPHFLQMQTHGFIVLYNS